MPHTAVVLVNIGSPESPSKERVGIYLKKFLMDKKVINVPYLLRWILVHLIIVPRRAAISAGNYQKIWMQKENLSPLIFHSKNFETSLQRELGENYLVKMAMLFSGPNFEEICGELIGQSFRKVILVPMFPQYADATTGSVKERFSEFKNSWRDKLQKSLVSKQSENIFAHWTVAPAFYQEFSRSAAQINAEFLAVQRFDHYLFSFHGLPKNQVQADPQCRLSEDCCTFGDGCVRNCYRAHCLKTAEIMSQMLKLPREQVTVSFQSRLGRAKWLEPYTSEVVRNLANRGVKRLAVFCPSFVVDCLETLEEIGLGEKENFQKAGGEFFQLIPAPNENGIWVKTFADFVRSKATTK